MAGDWKVLRTGLTTLADADWHLDVSDTLPSSGTATLHGDATAIEFVVWAYLASDGFLSDVATTDTFSCQLTLIEAVGAAAGTSNILGRDETNESLAMAQVDAAGLNFHTIYRMDVGKAASFTLRLHTLSGAPGDADRYEVWWREV